MAAALCHLHRVVWCVLAGISASGFIESQQVVDLMLLDIRMPDKTGLEVVADLDGILPPYPIIAMTGHVDEDALAQFK